MDKKSFAFLKKKLKKLWLEITLLSLSIIVSVVVLILFFRQDIKKEEVIKIESNNLPKLAEKYYVDISGAVKKPNVYQVKPGTRLKEVLEMAGGISDQANQNFFARNFNLARFVSDQEKIYIPSIEEINSGLFTENSRSFDFISPVNQPNQNEETDNQSSKISINQASEQELDQLPGIGAVTAKKIIDNRPYSTIEDLLNKKVVNQSVFNKIKDLIEL
jgi:competence protein ComEA